MKKQLVVLVATTLATSAFSQLPVSHTASNKKALLAEYTGIHCVFCPDGHKIAGQIIAANPGNAFAVNIHDGSYATPNAGELDFRTLDGYKITTLPSLGIAGYPAGDVNRHIFSGGAMAMSRGAWTASVSAILGQSSYVNIAGQATLNANTNQLTVNIEAYYTANSPSSTNKLSVMLLQNNIGGTQTGGSTYNPSAIVNGLYMHQHALRDVITTNSWGDLMGATTSGTTYSRTITYTVPSIIRNIPVDMSNLEIVAFVTQTDAEVMTACKVPITITGVTGVLNASPNSAEVGPLNEVCSNSITPTFNLKNLGTGTMTSAAISYSVNNGTASTYNWAGSLTTLTSKNVTLPAISYTLGATNTININVTSVNGGADANPADNSITSNFIPTTALSNTTNISVNITQDKYGTETTWKIFNSANAVVASGGPYTDLAAYGTQLHSTSHTLLTGGCYRFEIYDLYGDGINFGYGAGSANIKDGGGNYVYSNNGMFEAKAARYFKIVGTTSGIDESEFVNNVNVYPNPLTNNATINFNLNEENPVSIVLNSIGQAVVNDNLGKLSAGEQNYALDASKLSNGIYFLNVTIGNHNISRKISVNK